MSAAPAPREDDTDEAHLAAVLAVLTLVRASERQDGTPLQRWRTRRLAALGSPAPPGVSACCRCGRG
jgi:hypothetical protein